MELSRDWGGEWLDSLQWIAIAFVVTVVVGGVVTAVILASTAVGRHFWSVNRDFFFKQDARGLAMVWGSMVLLTLFLLGSVRLDYVLSFQGNDMYTAIQAGAAALGEKNRAALDSAQSVFWFSVRIFGVLATIHVLRSIVAQFVWYRFECRWRSWLTSELIGDWMGGEAAYRARFVEAPGDNPDQRIDVDVTDSVELTQTLYGGLVTAMVSMVVFTKLLWDLSGPLSPFGVTVPHTLVWITFAFFILSTAVTWIIGRPMIRWNFRYQRETGAFRAQLVHTRDAAEEIALVRGGRSEVRSLNVLFGGVIRSFWRLALQTIGVSAWDLSARQTGVILPILVQSSRFFSGGITLGGMTQSISAFGSLQSSLVFLQTNYPSYAHYRAALIRLHGLKQTNTEARKVELPLVGVPPTGVALRLIGAGVTKPDGSPLVRDLSLEVPTGGSLLIQGPSGVGKSTLLRATAGLWPFTDGTIEVSPPYVVTQVPYVPRGTLREVLAYPRQETVDENVA